MEIENSRVDGGSAEIVGNRVKDLKGCCWVLLTTEYLNQEWRRQQTGPSNHSSANSGAGHSIIQSI